MRKNCIVCGGEKFKSMDHLRLKPCGMVLCESCGMVMINRFKDKSEMDEHYKTDSYRKPPSIANYYTGNLKLKYHMTFLNEYFKEFKKKGIKPAICDVGAAHGMFLNWIKSSIFPPAPKITEKEGVKSIWKDPKTGKMLFEDQCTVDGTELTDSFVKNAYWEYGVKLTQEIDKSKKYDMICAYKVLEHIPDVNEKLKDYHDCLKDDGYFYVSNPTWFKRLYNFGSSESTTFDTHFHPDHINAWSENHSQNILKKAGFKIVKENYTLYDSTYMCVKTDEKQELIYEDPKDIEEKIIKIKKAIECLAKRKPDEALKIWPDYPEAWIYHYEFNRKEIHEKGGASAVLEYVEDALKKTSEYPEMYMFAGELCKRYELFDKAAEYFQKALDLRPESAVMIKNTAMLYNDLFHKTNDINYLFKAKEAWHHLRMNFPNFLPEAMNWIYSINSTLDIPKDKENKDVKK